MSEKVEEPQSTVNTVEELPTETVMPANEVLESPKGEGPTSLSEISQEVVETIDTSTYSHPEQKELLIFNLDFEEMAQAMFGQIDAVDELMEGNIHEGLKCSAECIPQPTHLPPFLASGSTFSISDNTSSNCITNDSLSDKVTSENTKQDKKKEKSETNKKSKEDKNIDHLLKNLSHLKNSDEKLHALGKKFSELTEEHKALQHSFKAIERKHSQLQKEKEQLQAEHGKAILTRTRLESLCRELQRQNKAVKDESLMRVREEEEKRKEVSAKFQTTFTEVTNMMQDSNQKSSKLREENMELAQKLKTLIEQYELREQQVDKIIKHKELELQFSEAKLAKANMLLSEEREKLLQEKHKLLQDLTEYQQRCHELTANEVQLRSQLSLYTDKYDEFQGTLNKSNEVFTHFKKEMDKMSKKIKKLQTETGTWRMRWENSNKALLEMAAEKQQRDTEYANTTKKLLQLEKLCRALQTERKVLLSQLKNEKETSQVEIGEDQDATTINIENVERQEQTISTLAITTSDTQVVEEERMTASTENFEIISLPENTAEPNKVINNPDDTLTSGNVSCTNLNDASNTSSDNSNNEEITPAPVAKSESIMPDMLSNQVILSINSEISCVPSSEKDTLEASNSSSKTPASVTPTNKLKAKDAKNKKKNKSSAMLSEGIVR